MQNCKVSVIIPVYNAEKYLREAIKDLRKQTFQNFEMIFVNDGSTDSTREILQEAWKQEARIKVFSQENRGAGAARNRGLIEAEGEYLLFLDADDRFEPTLLERVYRKAAETKAEIVVFDADAFDCISGKRSDAPWLLRDQEFGMYIRENGIIDGAYKNAIIYSLTNTTVWNKLFRADFVKEKQLVFQEIYVVDSMYFVMLALTYAERIAILHEKLLHYRKNNPTGQLMNFDKNPLGAYEALGAVKDKLEETGKYSCMEKFFRKFAWNDCCTRFRMLHSLEAEKIFFNILHDGGIRRLGLEHGEEWIKDKSSLTFYKSVKEYSYEEYRVELDKKYRKYGLDIKEAYAFPSFPLSKGSQIVLYGAGSVGKSYFIQIMNTKEYKIVGWVDKQYQACGYPIEAPEKLSDIDCDGVVISVFQKNSALAIRNYLESIGIKREKIYWKEPIKI